MGIKNATKSLFSFVTGIPRSIYNTVISIKNQFHQLRYNLNNLSASNIKLGIYHLKNGNLNDAIFRFKLVEKYLEPGNKIASYWLGWTYFLKNNFKNSIIYFTKAEDKDELNMLSFIKSIDTVTSLPTKINQTCRDLMAANFIDRFDDKNINIPKEMVIAVNEYIETIPEEYSILELGNNVGLLSSEIKKRMQDSFTLTVTELSTEMIDLQNLYFPDQALYDKIYQSTPDEFLQITQNKYDIIMSLEGVSYTSDPNQLYSKIFNALSPDGYFAFAVRIAQNNLLSNKYLDFAYNPDLVANELKKVGFSILSQKEIILENNNKYHIFVCKK